MNKKNLTYYIGVLLVLCNCAPHNHYYKSQGKSNEDRLEIFCTKRDKIWLFDRYKIGSDTILIHSNHFEELNTPKIMDTLSYRMKDTQKSFLIKINDGKFHKQIKNDTVSIKYKKDDIWTEEKFIIINDNRIK